VSPKRVTKPLDIYVRVSDVRDRAGETFISPEDQEERCRAAIASRGLKVGDVFLELNVSGGKMDRPELAKARRRIEDGLSGGLVVAKLDRFGRTVVGALQAIEEIDQAGGVVVTAEGDFDTSTAVGELVLNMMLTLAQFELRRIRDNWNSAQRRAVERGVHISRHPPPGYERGDDARLFPHPKHGPTMSEAFGMAAAGRPPAEIARFLNERELPSGNGATHWASNRIKRLLANPVYLGEARYGDMTNPDAHEPLTDGTTFFLAQRDKKAASVSADSPHLLSGLVRCAACMHAMRPQKARGATVGTYRCATDTASGKCPHPSSISMNRLHDFVLEQFTVRAFASESEPQQKQEDSAPRAALEEAQRELDEVRALEGELRPAVFAQALNAALDNVEKAQEYVVEGQTFDDQDVALLVNAALPLLDESKQLDSVGTQTVRAALAREIQAVFVRPAASRSNKLPISDRVRIVWSDEESLELPRRGERFEPRPYVWN
jgi:DNA invertase Pin-like site-specific DNA recombinase